MGTRFTGRTLDFSVSDGRSRWTCIRPGSLAPSDTEEWIFQVRLDSDAPAGEPCVAAAKYDAYAEDYETETVMTVSGSGDGSGDDGSGGAAMTPRSRRF